MTDQELRSQVESAGIPMVGRTERYEDSNQFIGKILGETTRAPSPIALAFVRACGMGSEPGEEDTADQSCSPCTGSCGVACDSDCGCC